MPLITLGRRESDKKILVIDSVAPGVTSNRNTRRSREQMKSIIDQARKVLATRHPQWTPKRLNKAARNKAYKRS